MASSADAGSSKQTQRWGRVLIVGGTDWQRIGRSRNATGDEDRPDLDTPHILRSLSNVRVASVHASSLAAHFVCIDTDGGAWLFGRNENGALGALTGGEEDGAFVPESEPLHLRPSSVGSKNDGAKFVHAILSRHSTILVDSDGAMYATGENRHGQLGVNPGGARGKVGLATFERVKSCENLKVVGGSAGASFTMLLTDEGHLYAMGSGEHGRLGNGRTGEHIPSAGKLAYEVQWEPARVKGDLAGARIKDVKCGTAHTVALAEDGMVYTWGYNGYCRLGLQDQKDRLVPTCVPQFAREQTVLRGALIGAGPACSTVVDRSGILHMAGKYRNTGDGGGGQPLTTFKYIQEISSCKVFAVSSGGFAHYALAPEHTDPGVTLSVAYGQGCAHGELGLGADEPRNAAKPVQIKPLEGLEILSVAAGLGTTLFLAVPSDTYADLPRLPALETADECIVCGQIDASSGGEGDGEGKDEGIVCDFCEKVWHNRCLGLEKTPEEAEWFCPEHATPQPFQSHEFADEAAVLDPSATAAAAAGPARAAGGGGRGKKRAAAKPALKEGGKKRR